MQPSSERPSISVVVVAFGGPSYLSVCLKALAQQVDAPNLEVIVPWDQRLGEVSRSRAEFPEVQFVQVEGRRTYAELRAIGVKQARGEIVAVTEDHYTPNADWSGGDLLQKESADA